MTERAFAIEVVRKLRKAGFTALWAGGCVRDELLGLTPADYDVATNAEPTQLPVLFPRRNEIGAHFGVVQVIGPRGDDGEWLTVEVATFRIDGPYDPSGRTPGWVKFCSPEEDARRRDFTINGMFFDPIENQLIDYVDGRSDLKAKILRAIGNPRERFTEDKLRILRAVRMASRFELSIEPETLAAAQQMAPEIGIVSAERIAEELRKLLTHPNRARGVKLLMDFGLIEPILPELYAMLTAEKTREFPIVTGNSLERVIASLAPPASPASPVDPPGMALPTLISNRSGREVHKTVSFPLALAALLQELGKKKAEAIADRLRLSTAEKSRLTWLVEHRHALTNAAEMSPSRLYPLLVHPGIDELLLLHQANALASGAAAAEVKFCEAILGETPAEVLNPIPVLTGDDLIAHGLRPSREFKRLLETVRTAQLDGQVKDRAEALLLVRKLQSAEAPELEKPRP